MLHLHKASISNDVKSPSSDGIGPSNSFVSIREQREEYVSYPYLCRSLRNKYVRIVSACVTLLNKRARSRDVNRPNSVGNDRFKPFSSVIKRKDIS